MRKKTALYLNLLWVALPFLFSRCTYHSYFLSPFHGSDEPYRVIPLRSDSTPSATYISGTITEGGANAQLRDNVASFTGSIYRSHNFGHFQGFYGAAIALGSYSMGQFPGYRDASPGRDSLPPGISVGNKFFGGYSASGGMNFVLPFGRGGEWRVVGLSFTLQKEFGEYLQFRKALPDTLADDVFNRDLVGMLGVSTEFVWRLRRGGRIGYKLMVAGDILNDTNHFKGYESSQNGMIFFQQSLSFTENRVTGVLQLNAGNHVLNTQLGVSYRLGPSKRPAEYHNRYY